MKRQSTRPGRRTLLATLAGALLALALLGAAPALAQDAPYWRITSRAAPTNLPPGGKEDVVIVTATNLGAVPMTGESTITDKLPAGLTATSVTGALADELFTHLKCTPTTFPASEVSCSYTGTLQTSTALELRIKVNVDASLPPGTPVQNTVLASGGGAPAVGPLGQPLQIGGQTGFGVEKYELEPEQADGSAATQAGSHPFQLTTNLTLNENREEEPVELGRNLQFNLPPGLIGNPLAVPACSQAAFTAILQGGINQCPPDTAVGVAELSINEPLIFNSGPGTETVPVFNLEPAHGEPAAFGIVVEKVPIELNTSVRTGSDYGVTVTIKNASQAAGFLSSKVTFWGVPGDPSHNGARGWECAGLGGRSSVIPTCTEAIAKDEQKTAEEQKEGTEPKPFLSLPTSCGAPLSSPMRIASWAPGAEYLPPRESEFQGTVSGCSLLEFNPSIGVEPETQAGSTTSGVGVTVSVPQPETAKGLAQAAVNETTIALPEGLQLSPGAANGLLACSALDVGFLGAEERAQTKNDEFSPAAPACPEAAKVGTVSIKTPLLKNELKGSVFLASQDTNPFEAPLVIYLTAEDPVSGVVVKLAGKVTPNPVTGQLVSTFENTPQVPFEDLKVQFFGGPRASLSTPASCGNYTTSTSIVPWSGNAAASPQSSFAITSGPGGSACTSPQPFAPGFQAGSSNLQAGAFTPFSLTIGKPDGQQALNGITVHLPPGMAAMLSSVTPCPEPPPGQPWACGPASLLGQATTSSGLGGEPFNLPGNVFITTGYDGAPFGLLVETDAKAGPFNLGMVDVRSRINVNPTTAAVTITTDGGPRGEIVPTILKGVPVQLKQINVTVNRPGFQFNPTNCTPMAITGTLNGAQGGSAPVASSFQVGNCGALPFKPTLTATTQGNSSKAKGASLFVKITSSPGQANIAKTSLIFPIALPSRLTTIQKACVAAVFEANPAACDEGSNIGTATVHTPVLKSPLTGPAYLVSHGGAAFPDVEFVLQGEGITLVLDGQTNIKKGITSSTFNAVPDAPVTTFETTLPEGPHSALTSNVAPAKNYSLCGASLVMPTTITGQNGVINKQETKIAIQGCGAVKSSKVKKLTRAQKLKKALKSCRKKKNKSKRLACEKQARKKYGPKKKSKKKSKKK